MQCPKCKQEIDNDSMFCEFCGERIPRVTSGQHFTGKREVDNSKGKKPFLNKETMGTKNLLLILFAAAIVFNTILSAGMRGYEMEKGLRVDFSLLLSAGLFYWLFASRVADALKITLSFVLGLTGLIRLILMLSESFIAFAIILLIEVVVMAIAYYNSSK